jgi:hypothetical protein
LQKNKIKIADSRIFISQMNIGSRFNGNQRTSIFKQMNPEISSCDVGALWNAKTASRFRNTGVRPLGFEDFDCNKLSQPWDDHADTP